MQHSKFLGFQNPKSFKSPVLSFFSVFNLNLGFNQPCAWATGDTVIAD